MNRNRRKEVLLDCLKQFRLPAGLFLLEFVLALIVFLLYGISLEPFWYAFAITLFLLIAFFIICYIKEQRKAETREHTLKSILTEWNSLPSPEDLKESDYKEMIESMGREVDRIAGSYTEEQKETQDFYTVWVHQIKTPIAVMKLALGSSEEPDRHALQDELFRIEQYTDMVLAYQRLGSTSNDLLIKEYALDDLIREVIRKFASQFIYKKLKLVYEGTDLKIVIDRKWFICILEQLLSNALKYTTTGSITISVQDGVLSVADTGIGIAPEDLPRIFEKGFTGINGRINEHSSGLGLYLCGKASTLLNLPIRVESEIGKGSCFYLDLREKIIDSKQ